MPLPAVNAMSTEFMEPWERLEEGEQAGEVLNAAGLTIVDPIGSTLDFRDEARYMRRIVAAINACAGISTEDLASAVVFAPGVRRHGQPDGTRSTGAAQ